MAAALRLAAAARMYSIPLMKLAGLTADPVRAMTFLFALVKWIIAGLAVCAFICVTLINRRASVPDRPPKPQPGNQAQTDWPAILRLIGLMVVFTLLNAIMDMRFFPLVSGVTQPYRFNLPLVAAAVLLLSFLAGRSSARFLRVFLPPAIVIFILIPCLPLFQRYPGFLLLMGNLAAIIHYTIWAVISAEVVERYRGGFWFYACAVAVYTGSIFSFFGPLLAAHMPAAPEAVVLSSTLVAVLFMFLSFKILFPHITFHTTSDLSQVMESAGDREQVLSAYGLTEREKEVARLMLEGRDNAAIGEKLFVSLPAVKYHIGNIYRKFGIAGGNHGGRAAFFAKFIKGDAFMENRQFPTSHTN
jgi:DNA-binding CsgD family transcriptional regulator